MSKVPIEGGEPLVNINDHWDVYNKCGKKSDEIRYLKDEKEFDKALTLIEENLALLEGLSLDKLKSMTETSILDQLLERVEILTDVDYQGSVSPALLLQDLDRINELSQLLESWKLKSSSGEFYPKVRKALDMRERLRKDDY
ncbi:MAG: hypothetical protein P1Q69_11450 [Candidatus Thorarchaeota archaeon]|nr:hypothetical protein [Candidatus Thorarchaeota archaeon]